MRVVVLGGTQFVGRAVVGALVASGHEVLVVHRGVHEPDDLPAVEHLHCDRAALPGDRLRAWRAEAAVDVSALDGERARSALAALPLGVRLLALSSGDVYRAFSSLHARVVTDGVPLEEDAPLGDSPNLGIEAAYRERGGIVLRLGAVYGEYDYQHRQEFVLRRVRAGRARIPVGAGTFLFSRVYVGDVGRAVVAALARAEDGSVFNVVERRTWPMRLLAEHIVRAAGAEAELVTVADDVLPSDLGLTRAIPQHLLLSAAKARAELGWADGDPDELLRRTVAWDLANPPDEVDGDFEADDAALRTTTGTASSPAPR